MTRSQHVNASVKPHPAAIEHVAYKPDISGINTEVRDDGLSYHSAGLDRNISLSLEPLFN